MSMIFDNFASLAEAEAFRKAVRERFGLNGDVFTTDEDAYADDVRPWICTPPIVHIDRVPQEELSIDEACAREEDVERTVEAFGGRFTGT